MVIKVKTDAPLISEDRKKEILEDTKSASFKYKDLERRADRYEKMLSDFSLKKEHPLVRMVYQLTDSLKITSEYSRLVQKKDKIETNVFNLEETIAALQSEANSMDESIKTTKQMYDDSKCVVIGNGAILNEARIKIDALKNSYNSLQEKLEQDPENLALLREASSQEAEISGAMADYEEIEGETMIFSVKLRQFETLLNHYFTNKERILLQLEATRQSSYSCKLEINNLDLVIEEKTNPIKNAKLLVTAYTDAKESNEISSFVNREGIALVEKISQLDSFEQGHSDYEKLRAARKKRWDKTIQGAKKKITDDSKKRFDTGGNDGKVDETAAKPVLFREFHSPPVSSVYSRADRASAAKP